MFFKTPLFWNRRSFFSYAFLPFSILYAFCSACIFWIRKKNAQKLKDVFPDFFSSSHSPLSICIGNLVMGGAGKTPVCIALCEHFKQTGPSPHVLSRGYGRKKSTLIYVDSILHNAESVGDESLLLSQVAPTWVSCDRKLSAQKALTAGAQILIFDDGLQSWYFNYDVRILVIDTLQLIGNGFPFPSGPLRQPLSTIERFVDLIVFIHPSESAIKQKSYKQKIEIGSIPAANAFYKVQEGPSPDKPVIAFAGIGYPEKFRKTLLDHGYKVIALVPFKDHHSYTKDEICSLVALAEQKDAQLVTTEKDFVRIPFFREKIACLKAKLFFEDISKVDEIINRRREI